MSRITILFLSLSYSIIAFAQNSSDKFVVVGASAAGTEAVKTLCKNNVCDKVIWISDQKDLPYNTVKIGSLIKGTKTEKDINLINFDLLGDNIPKMKFGQKVIEIDTETNSLKLQDNSTIKYKSLFLGTGTRSEVPRVCQEKNLRGVFCFQKLSDAVKISNYIKENPIKTAIVVGFGFNGAEVSDILVKKGIKVHIVDRNDRILHRHINCQGAHFLQSKIENEGVEFHLNTSIQEIKHEDQSISRVLLENGEKIDCQLLIFTGVNKINSEVAKEAGITVENDAILVDKYLRTNIKNIFAGGDNILIKDLASKEWRRSCKWRDAQKQGAIAALNMLGKYVPYSGSAIMNHSRFYGYTFISCGPVSDVPQGYEKLAYKTKDSYKFFIFDNDNLKGLVVIGKPKYKELKRIKKLIECDYPISKSMLASLL